MKRSLTRTLTPLALVSLLGLAACGGGQSAGQAGGSGSATPSEGGQATSEGGHATSEGGGGTVQVQATNGTIDVPANPQRVVALDNTSFQTLADMGITPVAAPKQLLPASVNAWKTNPDIVDVGTHREPKLEAINEVQPDLIVGGKRFEEYTDQLSTIAPLVDLAPDPDKSGYVDQLKHQTTELGRVFGRDDVAQQLNSGLDKAVNDASGRTNGQTVFLANHNGGKIDNGAGRLAPIIEPLEMTDVFGSTDANSDSIHQDSGLAPETVAKANPDWMIVMDRDAATSSGTGTTAQAAQATVEAQTAWDNTTFKQQDQIVYLAPDFYTTEGIHAYTDAYTKLASGLAESN